MAEEVILRIVGDDRSVQQAIGRTQKSLDQFQGRTSRLARTLRGGLFGGGVGGGSLLFGSGAFISAAGVSAALNRSIDEASALNEEISKSRQIFGDASREVENWSETTASSMGISQRAALQATGTFGNLFRVIDLAPEKAAEMSRSLVQLASDLASFNNASPEDVLLAIRSGLIGEAEPLRRYGVLLSEARVAQVAMANSGKDNVKELTNQERALARYEIILQDTIPAQGDFARTQDGLANQSRILKARLNDLSADLGGTLVPVLEKAAAAANLLFEGFEKLGEADVDFDEGGGFDLGGLFSFLDGLEEFRRIGRSAGRTAPEAPAEIFGNIAEGITRELDRVTATLGRATAKAELEIDRQTRRQRRNFDALVKGLGLKLDRAEMTGTFDDDIAALRELERAIERQIRREGRTFELVELLTRTRRDISAAVADRAEDAADRARDAWEDTLDSLNLGLERAQATRQLGDDLRALNAIEDAIRRRIRVEGNTNDLQRQLLQVQQERIEIARQQKEKEEEAQRAERAAQQARQFRQLGLTSEGQERGPSARNLRRRLRTLREEVQGTVLDTERTRAQLDRIAAVLSGKFGEVGRDVRAAILEMFQQISDALEKGDKDTERRGEITRGGIRSTQKLIEGLGLTQEQVEAITRRNLGVPVRDRTSAFGFAVGSRNLSTAQRDALAGFGGGTGAALVIHTHVNIDGKEVATAVNRVNQKQGRRRAQQRRGVRDGRPGSV